MLSKNAAKRLEPRQEALLSLRLVVRNAAVENPATASVISAFTLRR